MESLSMQSEQEIILGLFKQEYGLFPQAKAIDFYKLLYQAMLGPKHFISDTSLEYLRNEISLTRNNTYPKLVNISGFHSLWRVNTNVVSEGLIGFDEYANAHFDTCKMNHSNEDHWVDLWQREKDFICDTLIAMAVNCMELKVNSVDDLKMAVSHSDSYAKHYSPHYRLINPTLLPEHATEYLLTI